MFNTETIEPSVEKTHQWNARSSKVLGVSSGVRAEISQVNTEKNLVWAAYVDQVKTNRDKDAFANLFKEFAPKVKGFLIKSGASPSLAEECMQDAMTIVWHKSHLFDPTRASVSTWIFTIARNKRIDAIRKQNRPEPENLMWGPESEPDAAETMEMSQENSRLNKAVSKLPQKQRDLVQRAFFGELSHQEIASETGLPLGTIKSRIRLALEKLRHEMK